MLREADGHPRRPLFADNVVLAHPITPRASPTLAGDWRERGRRGELADERTPTDLKTRPEG